MLSKNQMVIIRKAKELMYIGNCTVIEYVKIVNSNKSTSIKEQVAYECIPCRLSVSNISASDTKQSDVYSQVNKTIKLFLSPDIMIHPGSKIIVNQNGITDVYKNTGKSAMYSTHQEIMLEIYKDKA